MKASLAASGLAAVLLAGTALPSYAATFTQFKDFGAISDDSTGNASPSTGPGAALPSNPRAGRIGGVGPNYTNFQNVFQFSTDTGNVSALIDASVTRSGTPISGLSLALYGFDQVTAPTTLGGAYTFTGNALVTGVMTGSNPQLVSFANYMGAPGTYDLIVSGNLSSSSVTNYGGNLSVNAVPLPTSVALFGSAFVGLGVIGALRRKGKTVSAVS